jgi:hypothetical protein
VTIQADGAREPAINNQANGIHSALDVRAAGSRLSRKRPKIPAANRALAVQGLTHGLPRIFEKNGQPDLEADIANHGA